MLPQSCLGTGPFSIKNITGHICTSSHGHIHAHTLHTCMHIHTHTHMHRSTCTHMQVIPWDIDLRRPLDTKIYICSSLFHKMALSCAHLFEPKDSLPCLSLIRSIGFSGGIHAPLPPQTVHSSQWTCILVVHFTSGWPGEGSTVIASAHQFSSHKKAFRSKQTVPLTSLDSTGILPGCHPRGRQTPLGEQGSLSVEMHSLAQRKCAANHPLKDTSPGIERKTAQIDGLSFERDFLHPLGLSSSGV